MTDRQSPSDPPDRHGFERRWIKNANYTGPERRSGKDRRRYPPAKQPAPGDEATPDPTDSPTTAEEMPAKPKRPPTFKPYRP